MRKIMRFFRYVSISEIDERHLEYLKKQRKIQTSWYNSQEVRNRASHHIEAALEIYSNIHLNEKIIEKKLDN